MHQTKKAFKLCNLIEDENPYLGLEDKIHYYLGHDNYYCANLSTLYCLDKIILPLDIIVYCKPNDEDENKFVQQFNENNKDKSKNEDKDTDKSKSKK
jgi:hypothetical protein